MKLRNITQSTQFINTVDGGAIRVEPGIDVEVDPGVVFPMEMERVKAIFKEEVVVEEKEGIFSALASKKAKSKEDDFIGGDK